MKIRVSLSVKQFKQRAEDTWNLKEWGGITDPDKELLFFGLFNDRDWNVFDNFKGKKSVFWCGTDILQSLKDYERQRILRNHLAGTKHYCENEVEAKELEQLGLKPIIIPSFLDNINNYPVSFKPSKTPHIFLCGHTEREEEYGLGIIRRIAPRVPYATFHIYGVDKNSSFFTSAPSELDRLVNTDTEHFNIWYHGKIPEGQFNNEIMQYHCGLRTNEHDGFSEVTAKSLLLGQYPITKIPFEKIWNYKTEDELVALIDKLRYVIEPNYETRAYYLKQFNNFPWCQKNWYEPK